MMEIQNHLEIYIAQNGKSPFTTWLEALKDKKTRYIIKERIRRISLGILGDYKLVDKRIFELRIHYTCGYRLYFGIVNNNNYILLLGGTKSTQRKDIMKAKKYWGDYLARKTNDYH